MKSGLGYNCALGETWDLIAMNVYGDEKYARDILLENPAMCKTVMFNGGETIYLPVIQAMDDGTPESYTPVNAPWKD